ncbi:hypothetical protein B0O99DRAFT_619040 [Bisporella sp. PMI_857]|nr:hypothetical protein B0O99DRAFT_619040 [Bisporella sp. PMI_857]
MPDNNENKSRCLDFNDAPSLVNPQFYSHSVTVKGAFRLTFTSGLVGFTKDGKFRGSFIERAG